MKRLVKALDKLRVPAEPLEFITDTGLDKVETEEVLAELKEYFEKHPQTIALAAPQIGINKRLFGIRFNDTIKYFINPVVTKKKGSIIAPEAIESLPGKEILIARPEEITAVYYTEEFKYDENKFLGLAARIFDQMAQLLDGILPDELGLVSDIEQDGSLANATDEEMQQYIAIYKQFVATKAKAVKEAVAEDEQNAYKQLKFAEEVINGRAQVLEQAQPESNRQKAARRAVSQEIAKANTRAFVKGKK